MFGIAKALSAFAGAKSKSLHHHALAPTAVVFIDPRVGDVATLLAGLKPGERAFILDPDKDGLAQMARDLKKAHLTDLSSISVVAHGSSGALTLGKSTITDGDLAVHAAALAKIGAALKTNGTLNLYACNTAAGAAGRTFIADLSRYAGGADVAAATHQIGRAPGGENWTLDATTGAPVSADAAPFTNTAMQSYQGTLSGVFRVPQGVANNQQAASPILLSNGNLAVAYWQPQQSPAGQSPAYTAQSIGIDAFDPNGNRIGNEISSPAGTAVSDYYTDPVTATGASPGTFWVVSLDNLEDARAPKGIDGTNDKVIAQLFTASGSSLTATPLKTIIDNSPSGNNSGDDHENLSLVKLANGNYVLGWGQNNISYTAGSVQVQTFDSNFNPLSPVTTISAPSQTHRGAGPVVLAANGNTVSAIYRATPTDGGHEYGLTFDVAANGAISNQTTPVDLTTRGVPSTASVQSSLAELPGNKILVTYSTVQTGTTGNDLYGIIYNQDFTVSKSSFLIANSTPVPAENGAYAPAGVRELALPNGGFIVTYQRFTGTHQGDIFARLYDANNNPLTNEFLVDTPAANQLLSKPNIIAANGNGGLVITFESRNYTGNNNNPFTTPDLNARIYSDIGPISTGAAVTLASQYATPTSSGTSVSSLFGSAYTSLLNHPLAGVAVVGDAATAAQGTWQYSSDGGAHWTSIATNVGDSNATIVAAGDAIRFNPVSGYTGAPGGLTVRVWDGQDGFTADSTGKNISAYIFDTSGTSQSTSSFEGAFAGKTNTLSTTVIAPPTIVSGGYKISLISGFTSTTGAPGALTGDVNPSTGNTSGLSVVDVIYGSNSPVAAGTAVTGAYGTLTLKSDGSYTYVANQTTAINNAATGSHPLDTYTYDVSNGRTAAETFTVTIDRAPTGTGIKTNAPEGATTTGAAKAAFANETDPDGPGDTLSVASVKYTDPGNGTITEVNVGQPITGRYGTLTLKSDGSYSYVANNAANYTTDTLAGKMTADKFSYTSADQYGAASTPQVMEFDITCFATGTLIRTARGDVAVEDLAAGDVAVTASGVLRPITWIGHRTIDCRAAAQAQPVRVAAHAFGASLPARDLLLSPGHPVLVGADADNEGGHLVPIMCLINGTTISRVAVETVTYWHVELDAHDILLAEGLPAESYLDWGDRSFFTEGADHALANPDFVVPGLAGRCRPVALDGEVVEAERRRLDIMFALRLAAACAWPGGVPTLAHPGSFA